MITNNKLKTILPCNVCYKNNLPSFYYKTENFKTFRSMMISDDFNSSTFEKLLFDINNLTNEINNYLLNKKYVLLDLDLIHYSDITDSFTFLYLPVCVEKQCNDFFDEFEEFVEKIYYILVNLYPDFIGELKDIISNSTFFSIIDSINKVENDFQNAIKEVVSLPESYDEKSSGIVLCLYPEPGTATDTNLASVPDENNYLSNSSAQKMKSLFKHSSFNTNNPNSPITINMNTEVLGITLKSIFILLSSQIALLLFYLLFSFIFDKILASNIISEFPNYILAFAECLLLVSTFVYIRKIKSPQKSKTYSNVQNSDLENCFSKNDDMPKSSIPEHNSDIAKKSTDLAIYTADENAIAKGIPDNSQMEVSQFNNKISNDNYIIDEKLNYINDECFKSCKCEMEAFAVLLKINDNSIVKFPIMKEKFYISSILKITDLFISPHNNELILTSILTNHGSCFIEDSHSTSGTYLNGCLLIAGISHKLNDNDDIAISDEHFTFQYKIKTSEI